VAVAVEHALLGEHAIRKRKIFAFGGGRDGISCLAHPGAIIVRASNVAGIVYSVRKCR